MTASTQRLAGRFWPTFMQVRLAVAIVLLALQGLVLTLGTTRSMVSLVLCLVHLVAVLAANRMLPPPSRQRPSSSTANTTHDSAANTRL